VILERLPAALVGEREALRQARERAADGELAPAIRLARRYLALGRAEADPRYYGYAEAALSAWWDQPDPPPEVRLLRAVIRQARHDFPGALADLDIVLSRRPGDAQAWLTRAFVLLAQGRPQAAVSSCTRLWALTDHLVASACTAAATGRMGRAETAYRLLDTVVAGAVREGRTAREPEILAWALGIQAELAARLGRTSVAEHHYRRALALGIQDVRLMAAYADLLLDTGRAREAHALLEHMAGADALLLRLALAERALGDPALAQHRAALEERMAAARSRGDALHLREAARAQLHLLDDADGALELALANWSLQREPADARQLLEASLAADRPAAARPVLDWLDTTGLDDPRLADLARRLERHADAVR
jgi:hypothetical protein